VSSRDDYVFVSDHCVFAGCGQVIMRNPSMDLVESFVLEVFFSQ
jgi:hypothetical protein